MWRSLVARFVRDEEAAGSNPVTPTKFDQVNALARMSQPFSQCDLTVSGSGDVRFWEQPTSHLFTVELPARVRAYAVTPRPGTRPASRPHASLASALAEWDSGGPFYGGRKNALPESAQVLVAPAGRRLDEQASRAGVALDSGRSSPECGEAVGDVGVVSCGRSSQRGVESPGLGHRSAAAVVQCVVREHYQGAPVMCLMP